MSEDGGGDPDDDVVGENIIVDNPPMSKSIGDDVESDDE